MKKIFLAVFILVIIALLVFAKIKGDRALNLPSGEAHIITLTADGYNPENLSIKRGETVTFKTTEDKPFWPASNIHPTHSIYSEFDPKDAIMPDKTWSFKFEKSGKWNFHDHLSPYFTGTIEVTE